MIASPLGLRLDPERSVRDQIREAAQLGARGVVIDAIGDIAPARLSETGRRELRHLLRSVGVGLAALSLPTRRPFDTPDQLDDRLRRADAAFAMAFELGTTLVLARVGSLPPEADPEARGVFLGALAELGRRADHRGVRLAIETGSESGAELRAWLDQLGSPTLAASIDPGALLQGGHDPSETVQSLGSLVAHAYASSATRSISAVARSVRSGFPPGALDWESFLGALEEVGYRGYLTVWPEPGRDGASEFKSVSRRLQAF
ncbi:MAG: sugar phosphate isomerase/epimerase family protein [Isosphaeraceae bacterium]